MSSSPRSVVIGWYVSTVVNDSHVLVTCPPAITLILKSIAVHNLFNGNNQITVSLIPNGSAFTFHLLDVNPGFNQPATYSGYVVLGPGDRLYMQTSQPQGGAWCSGTVLQGVGVIPPVASTLPGLPPAS